MTRWQIESLATWPYPVTAPRKQSRFRASWPDTISLLEREAWELGVRGAVAVRAFCRASDIRRDGMLRANAIIRPEVVVSFESKHGPLSYPCDNYDNWQANVRAIALSLEALRAVDRYGVAGRGEQYTGWRAITSGPASLFADADEALDWLIDLVGRSPGAVANPRAVLRIAAQLTHPDAHGGDRSLWDRYDAARQLVQRRLDDEDTTR